MRERTYRAGISESLQLAACSLAPRDTAVLLHKMESHETGFNDSITGAIQAIAETLASGFGNSLRF